MSYSLNNNVIRSADRKVKFMRPAGSEYDYYHIGVWLESSTPTEMDMIKEIEYTLHPTFVKPKRRSANRANDFAISFWSWGTFEISAKIIFADAGRSPEIITRDLVYDLPEGEANYVEVKES